jgi:hypothetical protein
MFRRLAAPVAALMVLAAPAALAGQPDTWDGLTKVASKKFDAVYLLPGADFRAYSKIMLDPTEVAFEKNWLRDYNDQADFSRRLSQSDAQEMLGEVQQGFEEIFRKTLAAAGLQIVQAPGPDVMRVRTGVLNLRVVAPDVMAPGRSVTFSREAGQATLVVEARDSLSGALLGRAVDSRIVGDGAPYRRNSVTNRSDFERLFQQWAKISVDGIAELKARSPIDSTVASAK